MLFKNLADIMKRLTRRPELLSPIPEGVNPADGLRIKTPVATTVSPSPQPDEVQQRIDKLLHGFGNFGATPSAQAVRGMATAQDEYPIYKQHPYLLPALSIIETGAGQNMTRPKNVENPQNLMNWGIDPSLGFNPATQEESLERAKSGIGERSRYYQKFRDTGDLRDFTSVYAPENDGNEGYFEKFNRAQRYFMENQ